MSDEFGKKTGRPAIDMTGRVYGTLMVEERGPNAVGGGHTRWWCTCSACGTRKLINGQNLRSGKVKSCGCYRKTDEHRETLSQAMIASWDRRGRGRAERTLPHGHYSSYNHGCRCDECAEAHRAWRQRRDERELAAAEAGEPMRFEHGTHSAYTLGLCRCEECREAANEVHRKFMEQHRKDREAGLPLPDGVEHGNRYTYTHYACRCADCKEATRLYQTGYKARKKAGIVHPGDAVNRVERVRRTG